jgi:hypothetical protein
MSAEFTGLTFKEREPVVCVDDKYLGKDLWLHVVWPIERTIYTIRAIVCVGCGSLCAIVRHLTWAFVNRRYGSSKERASP